MTRPIAFRLNGKPVSLTADPARPLLWALRTELGLTGTKYGCGLGACGACTVIVDGRAVRSCQASVESVSGLRRDGRAAPPAADDAGARPRGAARRGGGGVT